MKVFSSCLMGLVILCSVFVNVVIVKEVWVFYIYVNKVL